MGWLDILTKEGEQEEPVETLQGPYGPPLEETGLEAFGGILPFLQKLKGVDSSVRDWIMQNLVPGIKLNKQESGWLPGKSPVTFGWKDTIPTTTAEGPLEAPKANAPMPKIPQFVRDTQAGTANTFNVTPQAERPGVSEQLARNDLDYANRHPELWKELQPEALAPVQIPAQAPPQLPLPSQASMQIPPPPERPDYAGRLRGITDAMPKTTADILPRPMAPKFKNIWLEAIRYALPAAVGQDPAKVETARQHPLDEQWIRDLGVASARLDAKTKAEVQILAQDMVDYNTTNTEYRGLLTELTKRYPGMAKNPDTLRAIMRTFHVTGKSIDAFMKSMTREDGTVDLGLSPKEQKVQEIKTQVEIMEEFLTGVPRELIIERAFGGGFTRAVDQIKGSLMAIIIDEGAPIAKKELAKKQLDTLTHLLKASGEDEKIIDKMTLLYKLKDSIVATQGEATYNALVKRTWQQEFGGVPPVPKEEKGDKALEEQRRFQYTTTTTGPLARLYAFNPGYLKDSTGEATRGKIEEWNSAQLKRESGIKQLEFMSKTKPLNPAQVEDFWKKSLTPKEFETLTEMKQGAKNLIMTDLGTGKMRVDPKGRPRAEIIAALGEKNISFENWNWFLFLVEQKDSEGRPAFSNQKIYSMLGGK